MSGVKVIVGGQDINYNSIMKRFIMKLYITNSSLGNKGINISRLVQEKFKDLDERDLLDYVNTLTESDYTELCKEYGTAESELEIKLPELNFQVFEDLNKPYEYIEYHNEFEYLNTSKIKKQLKYEKNPMRRKQLEIDLRNSLPDRSKHYKGKRFRKKK